MESEHRPGHTYDFLYPLAMEILHGWEAKLAAERQAEQERQEGRPSKEKPRPNEPRPC